MPDAPRKDSSPALPLQDSSIPDPIPPGPTLPSATLPEPTLPNPALPESVSLAQIILGIDTCGPAATLALVRLDRDQLPVPRNPARLDPAVAQPGRPGQSQPASVQAELAEAELARVNSAHAELALAESTQAESTPPDLAQVSSAQAESAQAESGQAELARPSPETLDPLQPDPPPPHLPSSTPPHPDGAPRCHLLAEAVLAGKTTAAMLVPTLRALLADALIDLTQLTAVVVVDGPGSFTGIRIGLSAVKALAEALNLPVYPISRLRVLAQTHSAAGAAMGAVLDAGRGEFYLGQYTPQLAPKRVPASHPDRDGIPAPASDRAPHPAPAPSETLLTREELAAYLSSPAPGDPTRPLVACEEKVIAAFPDLHPPIRLVDLPTAASAIAAALPDLLHAHAANVLTLDGRYIRRSGLYRTTEPAPPRPDIPRDITRP